MYEDLYPWVEHMYAVGYADAVKYEAILLIAEKEIYRTPKEKVEKCAARLLEIGGYKYISEAQPFVRKLMFSSFDLKMDNDNSTDLSDSEALHATRTMMTSTPIDSSGM